MAQGQNPRQPSRKVVRWATGEMKSPPNRENEQAGRNEKSPPRRMGRAMSHRLSNQAIESQVVPLDGEFDGERVAVIRQDRISRSGPRTPDPVRRGFGIRLAVLGSMMTLQRLERIFEGLPIRDGTEQLFTDRRNGDLHLGHL